MTFHEKIAWVMAVVTGLTGVWYANSVIAASRLIDGTIGPSLGLIVKTTIIIVTVAIVASIFFAIFDSNDDPSMEDERDRAVFSRAGNFSGWVLALGAIGALWHYYLYEDGNALFHMVVGALFIASVVDFVLQIAFYRRVG